MRTPKTMFLIVALLFSFSTYSQKIESPEELGELVFEALSKQDSVLFRKARTPKNDMKEAFSKIMEKRGMQLDTIEFERIYSNYSNHLFRSFSRTIEDGEEEGIIWSEIVYFNTYYRKREGFDTEFIEIGKTYIEFTHQGKTFVIKVGDSLKIKGNWSIEDAIEWIGEKNENE